MKVPANDCFELYNLNKNFKIEKDKYEANKVLLTSKIYEYIDKLKEDTFIVESNGIERNKKLKVQKIVQKKVIFDIEKLKKKIDKKLLKKFIDKTYTINDFEGLVEYLKTCGVDPIKFKSYLQITENVNQKKLDQLSNLGVINEDDIKGCYEVKKNEGYIKFTEIEE